MPAISLGGDKAVVNRVISAFMFGCMLLIQCTFAAVAADRQDDYLSLIELEAGKIDEGSTSSADADAEESSGLRGDMSINAFEQKLRDSYQGSFTFYSKLPRRSQEEIFIDYKEGLPIAAIRKKIMNRFLKR